MSKKLNLELNNSTVEFDVRRVVVAGYTGRDQAQVRAHIVELEKHGIPPPDSVPTMYPLDASYATVDNQLVVGSPRVSGEVEPGLLFRGNNLDDALVTVIVDFTDREEERRSIARSKVHPKPFSSRVWQYKDVADIWDEIALRSWVGSGPDRQLYQSGKFAQLLPPADLLARLNISGNLEGTVLLMGTVPLLSKEFSFSDYFSCEIETPGEAKLSLACSLRRAVGNS
jgi:hypothetical protein